MPVTHRHFIDYDCLIENLYKAYGSGYGVRRGSLDEVSVGRFHSLEWLAVQNT